MISTFNKVKSSKIVPLGLIFIAGIALGFFWSRATMNHVVKAIREGQEGYDFINPLLLTENDKNIPSSEYTPIKNILTDYIDSAKTGKDIDDISVYFRNLNDGQWVSVNPDETYSPASMLKVVTLISAMRVAETDPDFLDKPVKVSGNVDFLTESQTVYPTENPIKTGGTYTVKTLLDHLIIDSDNVANSVLSTLIGESRIHKTYEDLQLPQPESIKQGYTAEEYSHLFRALYNATYVSHSLSENLLELLSRTKFTKGLVAGVPEDVVVSHKFGIKAVRSEAVAPLHRELHDCGIIYFPHNPYFLCVMTRGEDFSILEKVIQDISKLTWNKLVEIRRI